MTTNQQKSQNINKREPISAKFKDVLCFQSSSRAFSSFLKNILMPLEVFRCPRGINNYMPKMDT
jgi:hypothetical protein